MPRGNYPLGVQSDKVARRSFYHKPKDKASEAQKDAELKGRLKLSALSFPDTATVGLPKL